MEDEVNAQVDQIVSEITSGIMDGASSAPTTALPTPQVCTRRLVLCPPCLSFFVFVLQVQEEEAEEVAPTAEDASHMTDMKARLEAL
jgi:hypothetical protein